MGVLPRPGRETWPLPQNVVAPGDDLAALVEIRLDLDELRRAHGRPGQLVLARPLQAHRTARGRAREQGSLQGHVVGAVLAVAAGALGVLHHDAFGRQREHERQVGAQVVYALAVRPDAHAGVRPLCHGARGRHRGMGDERPRVGAAHGAGHAPRSGRFTGIDRRGLDRLALDPLTQVRLVGQRVARLPRRARGQRLEARERGLFGLGHDAREAAVARRRHHAGHGLGPGVVERSQRRARRGRPQDAAVQQAWKRQVVDEPRPAEHLVGNVDALCRRSRQSARGGPLGRDAGGGVALEQTLIRQLPIARAQVARARDGAVAHPEALHGDAEPLGGRIEIDRARLGAGIAQGRPGLLDRQAARGHALVGARRRARRHHAHAGELHVELVGDDLSDGGEDALPDLDLAGGDLDDPVWAQAQPVRQAPVGLQAAGQRRPARVDDVIAESGASAGAGRRGQTPRLD